MTEQELGNLQYHCERTLRNHETPNDGLVPYYAREILALIAEVRRLREELESYQRIHTVCEWRRGEEATDDN